MQNRQFGSMILMHSQVPYLKSLYDIGKTEIKDGNGNIKMEKEQMDYPMVTGPMEL